MRLHCGVYWGLQSSENLTVVGDPLPTWLSYMGGESVLAIGRMSSSSSRGPPFRLLEQPQDMVAGFFQNEHFRDMEQATVPLLTWPQKSPLLLLLYSLIPPEQS